MGIYGIYLNQKLLYVGQATNFERRWKFHTWELTKGKHANTYLQRMFNKYGSLDFNIIEKIDNRNSLTRREIFWINQLSPLCNAVLPGENDTWVYSEERNKRVSQSNLGKPKTAEHRKNISLGRRGISPKTDPWNKGKGDYMKGDKNHFYGKHHSEETKTYISEHKKIKLDIDKIIALRESGLSFDKIAEQMNVSRKTISRRYAGVTGATYRNPKSNA